MKSESVKHHGTKSEVGSSNYGTESEVGSSYSTESVKHHGTKSDQALRYGIGSRIKHYGTKSVKHHGMKSESVKHHGTKSEVGSSIMIAPKLISDFPNISVSDFGIRNNFG